VKLKEKFEEDLKKALRAGDRVRVSTLRLVLSAIINRAIEFRKKDIGLSDEEVVEVLRSEVKKRRDAAEEFRRGKRDDLSQKEEQEIEILGPYLPPEMSDEDLERIVADSIREVGTQSIEDFGKIMKAAMTVLKGRVEGGRVSQAVKKAIGN